MNVKTVFLMKEVARRLQTKEYGKREKTTTTTTIIIVDSRRRVEEFVNFDEKMWKSEKKKKKLKKIKKRWVGRNEFDE